MLFLNTVVMKTYPVSLHKNYIGLPGQQLFCKNIHDFYKNYLADFYNYFLIKPMPQCRFQNVNNYKIVLIHKTLDKICNFLKKKIIYKVDIFLNLNKLSFKPLKISFFDNIQQNKIMGHEIFLKVTLTLTPEP